VGRDLRDALFVSDRGRTRFTRAPLGTLLAALAALGACSSDAADRPVDDAETIVLVDAAGDTLRLAEPPRRIVSLVPSVTQVVADLGELPRLVGRTRYDTISALAELPSVGEGMGPDYEALLALDPDVVIYFFGASDPETPAQLERLGLRSFGVRPERIEDVVDLYATFGTMLDRTPEADAFATALEATLDSVAAIAATRPRVGVSYLLSGDPPWAAGPGTYIGQLVELAGGKLLPDDLPELYAQISPEGLVAAPIDVILISGSSPLDDRLVEGRRVERIPAWVELPGPAVRDAARVILRALHPGISGA
jgi:iron complex transport system substrate-binding protein